MAVNAAVVVLDKDGLSKPLSTGQPLLELFD